MRSLRWAILALVAGVAGGVFLVTIEENGGPHAPMPPLNVAPKAEGDKAPWYQAQTPPPVLPNLPDEPIFFEDPVEEGAAPVRVYEEALPRDVYVPPAPVAPEKTTSTPPVAEAARQKSAAHAAWKRYAVATSPAEGRVRLAIVIDDMGVDRKRSPQVVGLPGPLTLSYLTYARDIRDQTAAARRAGHELMLHMAMEPTGKGVDPGPNVLRTGVGADAVREQLVWGLSRFDGYVGVNNHMGSKFTEDADGMAVVMAELKKRGLVFLDSRTTPRTVGRTLALESGVPVLERNVFLDHVNEDTEIAKRLDEAERFAHAHGAAIAIGHPRSATIRVLAKRLPEMAKRGIQLVPLTALLDASGQLARTP